MSARWVIVLASLLAVAVGPMASADTFGLSEENGLAPQPAAWPPIGWSIPAPVPAVDLASIYLPPSLRPTPARAEAPSPRQVPAEQVAEPADEPVGPEPPVVGAVEAEPQPPADETPAQRRARLLEEKRPYRPDEYPGYYAYTPPKSQPIGRIMGGVSPRPLASSSHLTVHGQGGFYSLPVARPHGYYRPWHYIPFRGGYYPHSRYYHAFKLGDRVYFPQGVTGSQQRSVFGIGFGGGGLQINAQFNSSE
jgi:hypothetical protein